MSVMRSVRKIYLALLSISGVLTVMTLLLLLLNYSSLPIEIPVYVKITGEVVKTTPKSIFTVLRLPVMALILQMVCLVMLVGIDRRPTVEAIKNKELNAGFWTIASLLVAIKFGFSSLGLLFGEKIDPRWIQIVLVTIGIIYIVYLILDGMKYAGMENLIKSFSPLSINYSITV